MGRPLVLVLVVTARRWCLLLDAVLSWIWGGSGSCCAACSASQECAGWNMPDGANGTTCQLMKEPLIMWEDGQTESKCGVPF